ncbi:hypothetical protein B0A48_12007 [Cryoendolithus antarcticus]|uniref:Uncharacterized protein n=1 Tax=Cryoendolithus antarcticus TaxID=1507870 RepID=A0A1V8STU3_9PEZI|nr:hypothetical protein B0A48_12007 [Cryoendolithus antarcticus]
MSSTDAAQSPSPAATSTSPDPQMIHGRALGPLEAQLSGRALSCFSGATLDAMHYELSEYSTQLLSENEGMKKNDTLLLQAVRAQRVATATASADFTIVLVGALESYLLDCFSYATYEVMGKKLDDADVKALVLVQALRTPNVHVFPPDQIPDYSQGPWIFGDKIFTSSPGNSHSRALPSGQAYGRWERVRIHGLTDEELNDPELQKNISQDHSILNDHEPIPCHVFVAATHELRRSIIRPSLNGTAVWQNWEADMNRRLPLGTSNITVKLQNTALGDNALDDDTSSFDVSFVRTGTLPGTDPRARYTGPVASPESEGDADKNHTGEDARGLHEQEVAK